MKSVKRRRFGTTEAGEVFIYTLGNHNSISIDICNYGGIVQSVKTPDKDGRIADVVLGYDTIEGYLHDSCNFGGIIGRYANRIANGKFDLDGQIYLLPKNDGENTLHGGIRGFDRHLWQANEIRFQNNTALELKRLSPDGEEGFPGNLNVRVIYSLDNDNNFRIDYLAECDRSTVLNLTNHSYFNLKGAGNGNILDHELQIFSSRFTPVGPDLLPTGEIDALDQTPLDFRTPVKIGSRIDNEFSFLHRAGGYDHNYIIDRERPGLVSAASVFEPGSGRRLEVLTTEPAMQFYSGNFLDGSIYGKLGIQYKKRYGFCLETQHYPDSPNHPGFPSTVLEAGEVFTSTTIYRFSNTLD